MRRGDELEDEVRDPGGDLVDGAEGTDAISEEAGGAEIGERTGEVEAAEGEVDGDGGEDGFGEGGGEASEEGGDLLGDGIVGGSACVTDGELSGGGGDGEVSGEATIGEASGG